MKLTFDTETIKSIHRRAQREELAREKTQLLGENKVLRDAVQALNARVDDSFELGYFIASYEVVQALLVDFDM